MFFTATVTMGLTYPRARFPVVSDGPVTSVTWTSGRSVCCICQSSIWTICTTCAGDCHSELKLKTSFKFDGASHGGIVVTRMAVKRVTSMHTARSSQTMRSRRSRTETWQDMASIGLVLPTFLQLHLCLIPLSQTLLSQTMSRYQRLR